MSTKNSQIDEYITVLGGCSCLARKLEVSRQAVWRWKHTGVVPPKKVMALCNLLENVNPSDIRPDIFYENTPPAEG